VRIEVIAGAETAAAETNPNAAATDTRRTRLRWLIYFNPVVIFEISPTITVRVNFLEVNVKLKCPDYCHQNK
jgi:hypothetical protein